MQKLAESERRLGDAAVRQDQGWGQSCVQGSNIGSGSVWLGQVSACLSYTFSLVDPGGYKLAA